MFPQLYSQPWTHSDIKKFSLDVAMDRDHGDTEHLTQSHRSSQLISEARERKAGSAEHGGSGCVPAQGEWKDPRSRGLLLPSDPCSTQPAPHFSDGAHSLLVEQNSH